MSFVFSLVGLKPVAAILTYSARSFAASEARFSRMAHRKVDRKATSLLFLTKAIVINHLLEKVIHGGF